MQKGDNKEYLEKIVKAYTKGSQELEVAKTGLKSIKNTDVDGLRNLAINFTSLYSFFRDLQSVIHSIKKNREVAYYIQLQENSITNNEKFVAAVGEKLASDFVSTEREIRDKVDGKTEICIESLRTIRLLISSFIPVTQE